MSSHKNHCSMHNSLLAKGVGHSNAFNWHKETMMHNVLDNNVDYGIYNSVDRHVHTLDLELHILKICRSGTSIEKHEIGYGQYNYV